MKITHFNGFDEDNNFRRQLKQKMQNFEPEVSNTLWDRIELNLANQQEKKSRKGLWMLVWFLSIGTTALLTWGVYDWTSANKNNEAISDQNKNLYAIDAAPKIVPLITTETTENISENRDINSLENPTGNGSNFSQNKDLNNSKNNYSNGSKNYYAGNNKPSTNPEIENPFNTFNNSTGQNNNKIETPNNTNNNKETETPNKFNNTDENLLTQGKTPELNSENLIAKDTAKTVATTPIPPKDKDKKKINLERFSVVFNQLSAFNYRTVKTIEGSSPDPEIARADDKNNYEKGAYTYANFNLGLQYKLANHWYISAGYVSYTLQNNIQYDSVRKKPGFPTGATEHICGDFKDSMAIGNKKTQTSIWTIAQIPVEITYKNKIGKKLSYVVGSGIEYNIVKNYMYRMYDAKSHNAFIPIEKGGEYEQRLPQASFKNYFSVQIRVGVEYQIFNRWAFRVNTYGSKAIQSYSKKESGVDTRPYRLGLQTGLIFNLK